ncbi:RNA polymerase sigma factor [Bryobacter aggregatus]|uniref:RNA polymerase sigma factor n=1 Tax=Bryobacter aggregatus TaxID=360054 RepID=UPI0004E28A9F|nr:RNA polymerase sigma factor [Bryobacter aggregatus]
MNADPQLVARAQAGDAAAFSELVGFCRKRVMAIVGRLIGKPEDVEDVAQDVFLRLYYSLGQLSSPELFDRWLYRLTVNAAYDYMRKSKRRKESRMADLSEAQMVMADASAGEVKGRKDEQQSTMRDFVHWLLSGVSEQDRILLMLKEVEGLSIKELEQIYGANESALKVRLFRARQRVLKAFDKSQEKNS